MFKFLNKPIEPPRMSLPVSAALALLAIIGMVSNYRKDHRYLGYYLLAFSLIMCISGLAMSFSKKERERARAKVAANFPDRANLLSPTDEDKIVRRRGYYSLAFGIALFLIWCWFFGFSSFAIGV